MLRFQHTDGVTYEWHAIRNINGSFYCLDCGTDGRLGTIVILFDDDTHECWREVDEREGN